MLHSSVLPSLFKKSYSCFCQFGQDYTRTIFTQPHSHTNLHSPVSKYMFCPPPLMICPCKYVQKLQNLQDLINDTYFESVGSALNMCGVLGKDKFSPFLLVMLLIIQIILLIIQIILLIIQIILPIFPNRLSSSSFSREATKRVISKQADFFVVFKQCFALHGFLFLLHLFWFAWLSIAFVLHVLYCICMALYCICIAWLCVAFILHVLYCICMVLYCRLMHRWCLVAAPGPPQYWELFIFLRNRLHTNIHKYSEIAFIQIYTNILNLPSYKYLCINYTRPALTQRNMWNHPSIQLQVWKPQTPPKTKGGCHTLEVAGGCRVSCRSPILYLSTLC